MHIFEVMIIFTIKSSKILRGGHTKTDGYQDFAGGPVKNLLCSAGDSGWISGQETKIPSVAEQLTLNAQQLLSPHPPERTHHCYRAHMPQAGSLSAARKRSLKPQLRPNAPNLKKKKEKDIIYPNPKIFLTLF